MDAAFFAAFRRTIDRAAERLGTFSDSEAGRPPAPGKWSKKEIVGHLIDSAANNHSRFVRAQLQEDLVSPVTIRTRGSACSAIGIDRGATWWRYGRPITATSRSSWNRRICTR